MKSAALFLPVLMLVWAGVTIGGSLIAAPAKFGAPSLDLRMALEVATSSSSGSGSPSACCAQS